MEAGTKVTKEELIDDGYEFIGSYGTYEIWIKGESRLLYNPRRGIVYYAYK